MDKLLIERYLPYLNVMRTILASLEGCPVDWAVTGSFGMALQGLQVAVHDIDLQTDKDGAYRLESCLAEYSIKPVQEVVSERIRSHLGVLAIDGLKVEIMGDLQKLLASSTWEAPVRVADYRHWLVVDSLHIPVLSLAYEYQAYLKLGRYEKAEMLRRWLQEHGEG